MKRILIFFFAILVLAVAGSAQEKKEETKEVKSSNLRQFYSGKFGMYQGSDG